MNEWTNEKLSVQILLPNTTTCIEHIKIYCTCFMAILFNFNHKVKEGKERSIIHILPLIMLSLRKLFAQGHIANKR